MVINATLLYDFLGCDGWVKIIFLLFHDIYIFIGFSYYVTID